MRSRSRQRGGMTWRNIILLTGCALLMGGCGRCNMLSSNNPAHCDAMLIGGMIVLSPVLLPMGIIENIGHAEGRAPDPRRHEPVEN
ncbi:MAG: hypothetical protein Q4F71_07805 [Paracoccus sp. (in: a-proteobacteria)]|nr:hypothetical protein [Paracoccus sp. (in: a-proteobacteria)]